MNKFVLAFILFMFSFAALADHQPRICDLYSIMTGKLVNDYDEQLVDARKTPDGGRYEIWKSTETGTWSVLEVTPTGEVVCLIGSGVVDRHTPDELMQRNGI